MTERLKALARLLLFLFVSYFVLRLLFYVNNSTNFSFDKRSDLLSVFVYGLRFDLAAIAATNSLFLLLFVLPVEQFYTKRYQQILKCVFIISNVPFFLLNFVDIAYFHFTQKRTTADFFSVAAMGDDFKNMMPSIIRDYWWVALLFVVFIWLNIICYKKIVSRFAHFNPKPVKALYHWLVPIFSIVIIIICVRGGIQFKPLNILGAARYTSTQNVGVVLNTTFTIIKTLGKEELEELSLPKGINANTYFDPVHNYVNPAQPFTKKNIVFIILESFGKEYIGYFNKGEGYTPFLDSLMKKSLVCTDAFANGKKSIEGVPAVIAGLPSLMNGAYINSVYGGNQINSLPLLLKKYGYSSAFFHGGNNGTMGFENFSRMAGYDKYIGRNEYPVASDYDGTWGIYDQPFFEFFCSKMSTMKEPFSTTFFSLTSHHPYKIPSAIEHDFEEGSQPIHKAVRYADFSLKKFFECASTQPWYKNALFVITADHTGPSVSTKYQTRTGIYSIPIIYFSPSDSLSGLFSKTTQQTDIVPSVLDYINYPDKFKFFGNSIFDSSATPWSLSYLEGIYQIITPQSVTTYDLEKIRSYQVRPGVVSFSNAQSILQRDSAVSLLKVIVSDFNSAMIHNKLTGK